MKRKRIFLIVFIVMYILFIENVKSMNYVSDNNLNYLVNDICSGANGYGNITMPTPIKLKGNVIYSYCEFENQNDALHTVYNKYEDIFNYIESKYGLEKMDDTNWTNYYEILKEYDDKLSSTSLQYLLGFF